MNDSIFLEEYDGVIREVLESGGEFRLYPRGTSMLPLLRQGVDSVSLCALETPPRKDDILFYRRRDGSYILHRVKNIGPEGLILWGDNQMMVETGIAGEQIIGRVTRVFRDEQEVDCQNWQYRVYLWLWQFMAVRRLVLPIAYYLRKEKNT